MILFGPRGRLFRNTTAVLLLSSWLQVGSAKESHPDEICVSVHFGQDIKCLEPQLGHDAPRPPAYSVRGSSPSQRTLGLQRLAAFIVSG